jgi:hypothetical protein
MAEMTAGGRVDRSLAGRDVLLATKLHMPRSRPGLVASPDWWTNSMRGWTAGWCWWRYPRVTAIRFCSRSGREARADPGPTLAWLSLDTGDNDPVRLWRSCAGCPRHVRPGMAGPPLSPQGTLRLLIVRFLPATRPVVLFPRQDQSRHGSFATSIG